MPDRRELLRIAVETSVPGGECCSRRTFEVEAKGDTADRCAEIAALVAVVRPQATLRSCAEGVAAFDCGGEAIVARLIVAADKLGPGSGAPGQDALFAA